MLYFIFEIQLHHKNPSKITFFHSLPTSILQKYQNYFQNLISKMIWMEHYDIQLMNLGISHNLITLKI